MDITVYLPDELGTRAKEAGMNLSRMLRDAVEDEFTRRDAVAELTEGELETFRLDLEDKHGRAYTGRLEGKLFFSDCSDYEIYVTSDERVLVYERNEGKVWEPQDMEEDLRAILRDEDYIEVMHDLGERPVIDL